MSHRGPSTKPGVQKPGVQIWRTDLARGVQTWRAEYRSIAPANRARPPWCDQPRLTTAAIDRCKVTVQSASPTGGVGDREASCSALVICSSGSDLSRPL